MTFMEEAIERAMPLWKDAANEPFLDELGRGTLDRNKFYEYIVQDSIYLRDYLKAFAMAMFKSRTIKEMQVFYSLLGYVNDGENVTRLKYLADFGMTDADVDKTEKKPACAAYTKFLIDTAVNEDVPEILMAVMPCMLGYKYVFDTTLARHPEVKDTYFAPLVADYTADFYTECCEFWTAHCNEVCGGIAGARREKLIELFRLASAHELYFWQMAGGKR